MTGPEPLLNVYPSETERNQFMLIGLVSDGGNSDEQVELREIDSEQGQERILQEAKADEYGYFYISGICLERFDFSRKKLIVNFVHSGHRAELNRSAFNTSGL